MIAKRAIGLKLHRLAINRDLCLRMRAAIKDHLGIYVHEEFSFRIAKGLGTPTRTKSAEQAALRD